MSVTIHVLAAFKTALRTHVLAQAEIAALIGQAFHDMPPRTLSPPYLAFGDAMIRDDSSQLGEGAVIEMDLNAVAHERGTTRGLALLAALEAALSLPLPALEGHRLVALERPQARIAHDPEKNLMRASLRLRAFTERL